MMDRYLPDALVKGYEVFIPSLELPDPDDRHVLAAAIQVKASAIITFNKKDFPSKTLAPHGIEAIAPDDLVLDAIGLEPEAVLEAAKTVWKRLKNPPLSWDNYLENLERCGLTDSARWLRQSG